MESREARRRPMVARELQGGVLVHSPRATATPAWSAWTLASFTWRSCQPGAPPVPNPRALEGSLRKLRRVNRELARRQPGSRRRRRTRFRLARVHVRVANLRRDALHKLTTELAKQYGTVVVEDLNIAGLVRNRRLARALTDASMGELRRMLMYKSRWYGSRLVVADRFYPSSKTCSACGWVKTKLLLGTRTYTCEACGLSLDRDLNAARNLAKVVAQSGWETRNARGADVSPGDAGRPAMKREAGIGHRPEEDRYRRRASVGQLDRSRC
jgi:putative transposase